MSTPSPNEAEKESDPASTVESRTNSALQEQSEIIASLHRENARLTSKLAAREKDVAAYVAELKLAQGALVTLAQQNHRTATAYFSDLAMEQGRTKVV